MEAPTLSALSYNIYTVEIMPPSDVIFDVLHSPGKSTKFICGKLLSPDGAVMASLRRSPTNGGVQFSPLSMLHLFCSAISIEKNNNRVSSKFDIVLFAIN